MRRRRSSLVRVALVAGLVALLYALADGQRFADEEELAGLTKKQRAEVVSRWHGESDRR